MAALILLYGPSFFFSDGLREVCGRLYSPLLLLILMVLAAEWIHFTFFGIILPSKKLKV